MVISTCWNLVRHIEEFFIILTILLVCLKRKPAQFVVQTSLNGLVIGPELVIIPENHCLLWTATRDFNQRKFNYPTSCRYGLKLNLNYNPSHIFLLILLSGDVATNPGPCSFVKKKTAFTTTKLNVRWLIREVLRVFIEKKNLIEQYVTSSVFRTLYIMRTRIS